MEIQKGLADMRHLHGSRSQLPCGDVHASEDGVGQGFPQVRRKLVAVIIREGRHIHPEKASKIDHKRA